MRGLNASGAADKYSRKTIDELTEFVGDFGAKGLAFFRVKEGALDSPIAKFFSAGDQQAIIADARRRSRATCCSSSPTSRQ